MQDILTKASTLFDVTTAQIVGHERLPRYCEARCAVAYAVRERGWSLQEIGRALDGRNHATVLYNIRQASRRAQTDPWFAVQLAALL